MKKFIVVALIIFLTNKTKSQNSFKINSDSTLITDNSTGLMWMRYDYAALKKRFFSCWDSIFIFKNNVNSINYGGYNDWQIPSILQYRTINNSKRQREEYKKLFVEIDSTFVRGKGAYSFWSSNTKSKFVASYISFIDGFATSGDKCDKKASGEWEGIEFGFSVRLVRKL